MKKWNEHMLSEAIISECPLPGIMPSNTLLKERGRNDLISQITRRGGFIKWASKLNLTRPESDSDFGWECELLVSKILEKDGYNVERQTAVKFPFDIMVDDVLRVDVKGATYKEYGPSKGWFYRIGKAPQADVMALYQYDTGDCYWIPWTICPRTNITISTSGGIYKEFKNDTGVVADMVSSRRDEHAMFSKLIKNY